MKNKNDTTNTNTNIDGGINATVQKWSQGSLRGEIAASVNTFAKKAVTTNYPNWLDDSVVKALKAMGIEKPYSHQVKAWNILDAKKNLIVATPTASGKTLCYNIPVLNKLAKDPNARALYMFPTKALARDQEAAIKKLIKLANIDAKAVVYDGDTPVDIRRKAKTEANIIITNPDMLHTGIMPHHASWAAFFAGLSFVVIDELHQYRGVFGAHVANVIRRLHRISKFHGAHPVFASCSATIGNPLQLAQMVMSKPATLVQDSGAPTGPKKFIIYNPEIIEPVMGLRKSAFKVAAQMAGDLIENGVTTLIFCQTRRGVEVVLRYLRDRLLKNKKDPSRVRGYRGGYLPTLRREVETALREGQIDAVVATNALELGIDVGELDAVIMAGYPGTIASTHQRSGRAGRRQAPSLAVLIARSKPLDQFLVREPKFLLEATSELALVQPNNLEIMLSHLICAAFEIPFNANESFGTLDVVDTKASLEYLVDDGCLASSGNQFHFIGNSYPAANIGLRNITGKHFVIVDESTNQPLGEIDPRAARHDLHPHAIYQHEGNVYEVTNLDFENLKAYVMPTSPVYYTTAIDIVVIDVIEQREHKSLSGGILEQGDVEVKEDISGYKKIKFKTHENLGYGKVSLPTITLSTEAIWLSLHDSIVSLWKQHALMLGLAGLCNGLHQVTSLRLMCDPHDIAVVVQNTPVFKTTNSTFQITNSAEQEQDNNETWKPAIFLYDTHENGVGLSERTFLEFDSIFSDALKLITGCPCPVGCPACVGPTNEKGPPVKLIAQTIAALIIDNSNEHN